MAATPRFSVYTPSGEYIGTCKYAEDAGALISVQGPGATIRTSHRHRDIVWTEGNDGLARNGCDVVAKTISERIESRRARP